MLGVAMTTLISTYYLLLPYLMPPKLTDKNLTLQKIFAAASVAGASGSPKVEIPSNLKPAQKEDFLVAIFVESLKAIQMQNGRSIVDTASKRYHKPGASKRSPEMNSGVFGAFVECARKLADGGNEESVNDPQVGFLVLMGDVVNSVVIGNDALSTLANLHNLTYSHNGRPLLDLEWEERVKVLAERRFDILRWSRQMDLFNIFEGQDSPKGQAFKAVLTAYRSAVQRLNVISAYEAHWRFVMLDKLMANKDALTEEYLLALAGKFSAVDSAERLTTLIDALEEHSLAKTT